MDNNLQRGTIEQMDFRKLVENISLMEQNGTLRITLDSQKNIFIYFISGELMFIREIPPEENKKIGELLIKHKVISKELLEKALERQKKEPERFIGDILLEIKTIDKKTLNQIFMMQVNQIIYYILTHKGNFEFIENEIPERIPQFTFDISINTLINSYITIENMVKNFNIIKYTKRIFTVNEMKIAENQYNDEERSILEFLKKGVTLEKILLEKSTLPLEITLKFLETLYNNEIIKEKEITKKQSNKKIEDKKEVKSEKKEKNKTKKRKKYYFYYAELLSILLFALFFNTIIQNYNNYEKNNLVIMKEYSDNLKKIQMRNFKKEMLNHLITDPWGTVLKIEENKIISAGPDKKFGTKDDIQIELNNTNQ